jgi:hypothetical protein
MKRVLASFALLALFASPAAALTLWQGDMFVTAISETNPGTSCKKVNVAVGDFFRSVFRPKGLTDNGNNDLLSFVGSDSAVQLVPTTPAGGTLNGATAGAVRTIYGSAGFRQFTNVAFSGTTVTPAAPLADTPTVAIEITIKNVFSLSPATPSGCDATYAGSLAAVASDNLLGTWVANAGSLANASGIQTFTEDTSGNIHYLGNTNIPMTTSEEFTLSVKARSKPGQAARNLIFEVFLTGTSEHIAGIVSLSDGANNFTAASAGFVATSITTTSLGDEWWLIDVVFSAPVPPNGAVNAFFLLALGGADSYTGDGAAGIQFENASLTVNAP